MLNVLIENSKVPPKDDYRTPEVAVNLLLKYLPNKLKTIWECCDSGDSIITQVLKKAGFRVISTSIETGLDFLKDVPDFDFDIIITNPPFSKKDNFIKKCYEYNKSFALLLPISALGGITRTKLFKKNGVSLIIPNRRINFIGGKSNAWFHSAWFCKLDWLPVFRIYFEEI